MHVKLQVRQRRIQLEEQVLNKFQMSFKTSTVLAIICWCFLFFDKLFVYLILNLCSIIIIVSKKNNIYKFGIIIINKGVYLSEKRF